MRKIVIIGLGAAGYAALSTLKRLGCRDEITVIDPKSADLIHPCGLPYALEGKADPQKLLQNISLDRMGVHKIIGRAVCILSEKKQVCVETESGEIFVCYDSLLLCPGSSPVLPPLTGIQAAFGKGLFSLTSISDLDSIRSWLPGKQHGIVIGAGAIGLESASAFKKNLSSVTVIEMKNQILPGVLDPDMAESVREKLEAEGIIFKCGIAVEEILSGGKFSGLIAGGETFSADIGICAAGFKPNDLLLKENSFQQGRFGIRTDRSMRTGADGILAAGDCVETLSVIDQKPVAAKLATSAYRQGTAAAYSLMDLPKEYNGSAGTFVTKIAGLEIAGTGFTSSAAKERGFDPVICKISANIRPDYFYDNAGIIIKIIADRGSGRILGAQAAGEGAAARVNIVSAALDAGLDLSSLESAELAYCPAVSEVCDPLMRAVEGAMRRIRK